jgi:nicotinamide riboside kinase
MRIWITGSHSVGKTTLLNKLEWNKINEIARTAMRHFWKTPQEMDNRELEIFQNHLFFKQIREELAKWDFITDRTIIDVLAYSKKLEVYNILKDRAKTFLNQFPYDILFYIPIEFWLEEDWTRFSWTEYQIEIDNNIKELLEEFNIKYHIITWSLEERLNNINNIINEFKRSNKI